MSKIPSRLIVLEIANNHMGDIDHGLKLINEYSKVCRKYKKFNFAFKLQYRQLDTFIHQSFKERFDLSYIKRFQETKLNEDEFNQLINCIKENNFYSMVTAFDNESFDLIKRQDIDILKIASCSFSDWPLLESAVEIDKPIIASTAGAPIQDIDNVVSFFLNRDKDFAIMHCVAQYPTPDKNMHLSQIDFLQNRYSGVRVGFSTHENPDSVDMIKMAIAKGADIFEKHIALPTDKYPINKYSVNLIQFENWLKSAEFAYDVCGERLKRKAINIDEQNSLMSLRRGIFARRVLKKGHKITKEDIYFAYPSEQDQFTANEFSKYSTFIVKKDIKSHSIVSKKNTTQQNKREILVGIVDQIKKIILEAQIKLPNHILLEISHHYGLNKFNKYGMAIFTLINRSYCKKLLVCVPGQIHPEQYHKIKEETFRLLHGDIELKLNGSKIDMNLGEVVTVEKEIRHEFRTKNGCVIEEISGTHFTDDSYYTDNVINENLDRKTIINCFMHS